MNLLPPSERASFPRSWWTWLDKGTCVCSVQQTNCERRRRWWWRPRDSKYTLDRSTKILSIRNRSFWHLSGKHTVQCSAMSCTFQCTKMHFRAAIGLLAAVTTLGRRSLRAKVTHCGNFPSRILGWSCSQIVIMLIFLNWVSVLGINKKVVKPQAQRECNYLADRRRCKSSTVPRN